MANDDTELDGRTPAPNNSNPKNSQAADELSDPLVAGLVIDEKYRIESLISTSATGTVYRASHLLLEMPLAIKVLFRNCASDNKGMELFRKEVSMASSLRHPSIVTVIGAGVLADGRPYIAMDFFEGSTLEKFIAEKHKLNLGEFFAVFPALTSALEHAHSRGIVHLDVKPANIMVALSTNRTIEFVKLVDFGLAKFIQTPDENQQETQTSAIRGTSAYMSPEQCSGGHVDQRSDIYSLGCVMYEALTGKPVFSGTSSYEVMYKHLHHSLTKMSGMFTLPGPLARVINRCLKKDPAGRYQNIEQLEIDLTTLRDQQEKLASPSYWKSTPLILALTATVLVLIGVAFEIQRLRRKPTPLPKQASSTVWSSHNPSSVAQALDRIKALARKQEYDQCILTARTWLQRRQHPESEIIEVKLQLARELHKKATGEDKLDTVRANQCEQYAAEALKHSGLNTLSALQARQILASISYAKHPDVTCITAEYEKILNECSKLPDSYARSTLERDLGFHLSQFCAQLRRHSDAEKYARLALLKAIKLNSEPVTRLPYGINLASALWQLDRQRDSLACLKELLENLPAEGEAERLMLASWLADHQQYEPSLKVLDEAVSRERQKPANKAIWRGQENLRASVLEQAGRADKAVTINEGLIEQDRLSGDQESNAHLGSQCSLSRSYLRNGQLQPAVGAAITGFEQFHSMKRQWTGDDYAVYNTLLELACTQLNQSDSMKQYLQNTLQQLPADDLQRAGLQSFWLGQLNLRAENFAEAKRLFKLANEAFVRSDPISRKIDNRYLALTSLASLESATGDLQSAELHFRQAGEAIRTTAPNCYLQCMVNRAVVAINDRNYLRAEELSEEALQAPNIDPAIEIQLLIMQSQANHETRLHDAAAPLLKALQIAKNLPDTNSGKMVKARALTAYGALLRQRQDPQASKFVKQAVKTWQSLDRATCTNAELAQAYYELAMLEESTAKGKAIEHLSIAMKLALEKSQNRAAAASFAMAKSMVYKRSGQLQSARKMAEQAVTLTRGVPMRPDVRPTYYRELALIQLGLKEFTKSTESIQEGLSLLNGIAAPNYPCMLAKADLLQTQALVCREDGNYSKASDYFKLAQKAFRDIGARARVNLKNCLQDQLNSIPNSKEEAEAIRKQLVSL